QADAGFRVDAGGETVRGKGAGVANDKVGLAERLQLLLRGPDEHGVHEESVIWPRADDAYLDAVFRVPASEAVEAIQPIARVEVIAGTFPVDCERPRIERDVDRAPPHVGLRLRVLNDPLVLGRAARLDTGISNQCAALRDARILLVTDGVLIE